MASVVIELQQNALNKELKISDILRKALVVSKKLNLEDFQNWIEKELNGYGEAKDIPEYREVSGQIRGWNPYRGWIPLFFEDPKLGEIASKRKNGQSIAEIEYLIDNSDKSSYFHMPFPPEIQHQLSQGFGFETEVTLFTPASSLIRVLDSVRNILLNWALKLEEDNILGEGLSFTPQEKEAARKSPQNITNFYGPVQSPQIQQGSIDAIQISFSSNFDIDLIKSFIEDLKKSLTELNLDSESRKEVESDYQTVQSQLISPKPKFNIIKESLNSIRRILEGAGGAISARLLQELIKLL